MVAVRNRKISYLEVQRKKLSENIGQLRQARDRLICKLRTIPSEFQTNLLVEEKTSLNQTNESTRTKLLPNYDQNISSRTHDVTENVAADKKKNIYDPCNEDYVSEDLTLKMKAPIKNISNVISDVVHAFSKFQFSPSPPVIPAVEKPAPPMSKTPDIPGVQRRAFKQRKPKSRQEKLSEINYILGECKTTKPVNLKADFEKAEYCLLRPSGQQGTVAQGRGLGEVKCVTKEALVYSETAWKRRGVLGETPFEVTGKHDEAEQAVEPVHLNGKAELIPDGKAALQGQFCYL